MQNLVPMLDGGRAVFIVGEAGIGKTRLVTELLQRSGRSESIALTAACLPLASRLPLLPVVDLLRALLTRDGGVLADSVLEHCPPFVKDDVGRLLPELASERAGLGDEWQQQRLFVALVYFLRAVAAQCGLTVVVEDLHWSDQTTRDFLTYLLAHLSDGGPSLVMTSRSEDSDLTEEVRDWLQRMSVSGLAVRAALPPLSVDEVGELTGTILGSAPSPELTAELYRRTAGNAFFIEQLLAAGSTGRRVVLSEQLAQLLRDRASGVGPRQRRVLDVLAVAARPLTEDELARTMDEDTGTVRDAVRNLLGVQLARREGDGFTTRHALLGEALLNVLLPGEAAELHAGVASALDERHDPSVAAEVAMHWLAADRQKEELAARVEAAEYAETIFAFSQAAQHWQRALELAETVAIDQVMRVALRGMNAWAWAGDRLRGLPLGQRGLRVAELGGPPEIRLAVKLRVAMLRYPNELRREIRELERILGEFHDLPGTADQVDALALLYFDHRAIGQNRNGLDFLDRAVKIGAALPTVSTEYVRALSWLAYEQGRVGDLSAAAATMARAREAANKSAGPHMVATIAGAETRMLLMQNQLEDVVAVGLDQLQLLRSQGFGNTEEAGLVAAFLADALLGLGDVDAAGAIVDTATEGQPVTFDSMNLDLARCRLDLAHGRFEAAAARLEQLLALADHNVEVACVLSRIGAEIALWRGRPDAAVAALQPLIPRLIGSDEEHLGDEQLAMAMRGCADLAEAAAARRDPIAAEEANVLREELVQSLARMESDPFAEHPFFANGSAHGADWRAELRRSLQLDTRVEWNHAAQRWDELRRPHRAAYSRWRQAEALLHNGQRPEASTALRTAWSQAGQHQPLRAAIENLARMARIDLTQSRPGSIKLDLAEPPPPSPYHLTRRELDVLRLLVDGLTNAQIGRRLYMSPKTVSVHVTAILRKLQATNRVHAAAIAQRSGIID
jgi:DNA-binding CsgD family transcriptional regulator